MAAREAGASVFFVPAGENYQDARAVAGGLTLVPVRTFKQALDELEREAAKAAWGHGFVEGR